MLLHNLTVQKIESVDDLRAEFQHLGADLSASQHLVPALKVQGVVPKLARFVYQEMMLEGGWVALPARVNDRSVQPITILIGGTPVQLEHLIVRLRTQNTDELNDLADELAQILL